MSSQSVRMPVTAQPFWNPWVSTVQWDADIELVSGAWILLRYTQCNFQAFNITFPCPGFSSGAAFHHGFAVVCLLKHVY